MPSIRLKDRRRVEGALGLFRPTWSGREVGVKDPDNAFGPPCRYYEWSSFWGRVQLCTDGEVYVEANGETITGTLDEIDTLAAEVADA